MYTSPESMLASELPTQTSVLSILKLAFHRFQRIYGDWLPGFRGISVRKSVWNPLASIPSVQVLQASGCVHPGTPEMLRLLPEEDRHEEYIEVYTGFALNLGEDDGGVNYTAPDRILWNGSTWRVVKVRVRVCAGAGGADA